MCKQLKKLCKVLIKNKKNRAYLYKSIHNHNEEPRNREFGYRSIYLLGVMPNFFLNAEIKWLGLL